MYSTEPSLPKAQLAVASPVSILPKSFPNGEMTNIPPGPVVKILPFLSIFSPSGKPFELGWATGLLNLVAKEKGLPASIEI